MKTASLTSTALAIFVCLLGLLAFGGSYLPVLLGFLRKLGLSRPQKQHRPPRTLAR